MATGNVVVEKSIDLSDKKIAALDNLSKNFSADTTDDKVDTIDDQDKQPDVVVDDTAKDAVTDNVKDAADGNGDQSSQQSDGNKDNPAAADTVTDEPVPLDELFLEVDGSEKSVADLLNERTELSKRVAEIEKDPFLKGFIDHYLATGNANAYLEAKGVDWDKKEDVEVLRLQFERDNADFDPKVREKLWKRELADKYKIKPDLSQEEKESEDYEIAQALLKRDANKVRGKFKEDQTKFQIVDRKKEEPQKQQFDVDAYKKEVLKDKAVDSFVKDKILKLAVKNESGQSFGFEPENVEQVIEMMTDDNRFWGSFVKDGKINRELHAKVCAYLQNPDAFEQQLVEFGKTLGLEDRLKEVKNTDNRLEKKNTSAQTGDGNRWIGGAPNPKTFLKEALKQKK
jgi:hypothetical protein